MIFLTENVIMQGGITEKIEKVEVWYKTVMGITPSLTEAIAVCVKYEMDPELCMVPIIVYKGKTLTEVFTKKGE